MPKLVDNRSGMAYRVEAASASIGRHPSNGIVLRGKAISRFHAEIKTAGSQFYIRDLGSTYGTYLNGRQLDCQRDGLAPLHHGDRITLGVNPASPEGEYDLTFSAEHAPAEAAASVKEDVAKQATVQDEQITYRKERGTLVVSLSGTFRGPECDAMVDDVVARMRSDPCHVVIDLWRVTYMNSYVFGTLVKLKERLKVLGLEFTLAAAGGHVRRLLKMVGLSALFGTYPTVQEAIEVLHERRRVAR